MLSIIRHSETNEVVYISYAEVTHTAMGIEDSSIPDAAPDSWGIDAGYEKIVSEIELPADYLGGKYALVNDGEGYRWELLPEVTE